MSQRVLDFSIVSGQFIQKNLLKRLKFYFSPEQKSTSKISKEFNLKANDKSNSETIGYRYITREGRICRKQVSTDEKIFKTDNINSFSSKNKMKIRIGTRPQRYKKSPEPAFNFFNHNKEYFLSNEVDLNKAVIVDGCYDSNRTILERTAVPDVEEDTCLELPNQENTKELKKAIKATIRKMKIERLSSPSFSQALFCKFTKDTKPGFTSEHILKHKIKKDSVEDSVQAAEHIWKNIDYKAKKIFKKFGSENSRARLEAIADEFDNSPVPGSGLYDIGARGKRDCDYDENDLASSRVVHMPEFHNEIVMAPWIDSVTNLLKYNRQGPIYIGNSIADYIRYERDVAKSKNFLEGDWKRFDSTLYARICIIAIGILRLYYAKEDVRADAFFFYIMQKLILKDYYIPGGRIIRMIHGLPSGTKSTNLLGSIINLLCLNFCVELLNVKKFSFAVGGDDFVIFCKDIISEKDIDLIISRSERLGMKFKFLEKKDISSNRLEDYPYFYKYTVRDGKPYIKPADLLQRVFIPWNKNYNSSLKYFNFLEDQFPQLGYPNASLLPFYSIYCNMHRRLFKNVPISVGQVFERHKELFYKYSGKIFYKSLQTSKDEIYIFLKRRSSKKLSEKSKILLGYYKKEYSYYIYF